MGIFHPLALGVSTLVWKESVKVSNYVKILIDKVNIVSQSKLVNNN